MQIPFAEDSTYRVHHCTDDESEALSNDISDMKFSSDIFEITVMQNMFLNIIKDIKTDISRQYKKEEKTIKEIVRALEQSDGKHNLSICRINTDKMATGVVDAFSVKYSLTEEERSNLIEALKPLFVKDVRKGKS